MRDKSDENWEVALACLNEKQLNAAANRLYYSVFQSILSFAKKKQNYEESSGRSIHSDMGKVVRSRGRQREKYGRRFEKLRGLRVKADYYPETPKENEIKNIIDDSAKIREFFFKETGE